MTEIFMYADETGNLDYNVSNGASKYFGIGTATWSGDHGAHLWRGTRMRFMHAQAGVQRSSGYHAKNDTHNTRREVFDAISTQAPRFDTTFLAKANAYRPVRERGEPYLYRMAWYLHFKEIAKQVTAPGDTLFVAVATLGTKARKKAFQDAISEVCGACSPRGRIVVVAHWDSPTSWGLQVADYGLWAVQRSLESGDDRYLQLIKPTLRSLFMPWGRA